MPAYSQASMFASFFVDANGAPLSGGTLNAYLAGTTAPTAMYSDAAGTSAGVSVTLNARGEPEVSGNVIMIWLDTSLEYKFILRDSDSVSIWTIDGLIPSIKIGTTSGTALDAEDPRISVIAIDDLDTAESLSSTDKMVISQSGTGVNATIESVVSDPVTLKRGFDRDRVKGYTLFSKTIPSFSSTDGQLCGLEPWIALQSGTGASVGQTAAFFAVNGFILTTGSTSTGRAAIYNAEYQINPFLSTRSMDQRAAFAPTALPSVEAYTFQFGFITGLPSLATHGMYFQLSAANTEYVAVVKNAGGETLVPTGVTAINTTSKVFRVFYDADAASTKFYIDDMDTPVATILNSTRVVADSTNVQMAYSIIKSSGTTGAGISFLSSHEYDIETPQQANF